MISFFVPGKPAPGGSKRGFVTKTGKVAMVDMGKNNKEWRSDVRAAALMAYQGQPLTQALCVLTIFLMQRPKSHYGTGKNADKLKPDAPIWHTSAPDTTKLFRSTEDALTGIIWNDDAQIVQQKLTKRYTTGDEIPGAMIEVHDAFRPLLPTDGHEIARI